MNEPLSKSVTVIASPRVNFHVTFSPISATALAGAQVPIALKSNAELVAFTEDEETALAELDETFFAELDVAFDEDGLAALELDFATEALLFAVADELVLDDVEDFFKASLLELTDLPELLDFAVELEDFWESLDFAVELEDFLESLDFAVLTLDFFTDELLFDFAEELFAEDDDFESLDSSSCEYSLEFGLELSSSEQAENAKTIENASKQEAIGKAFFLFMDSPKNIFWTRI